MASELDFSDVQPVGTASKSEVDFSDVPPDSLALSQSYLDRLNSGQETIPATFDEYKSKTLPFFQQSSLSRLASGAGDIASAAVTNPGGAIRKISDTAGNLLFGAYQGIGNAAAETAQLQQDHPFTAPLRQAGALLAGAGSGIAGLAETGINGALKLTDSDLSPEQRAKEDYDRRQFAAAKQGVVQKVNDATGLPSTFSVGEQVAPLLLPAGAGIESGGLAARLGAATEDALAPAATTSLASAPTVASGGVGGQVLSGAAGLTHFIPHGYAVRGGIRLLQALSPAAEDAGIASGRLYQGAATNAAEDARIAQNLGEAAPVVARQAGDAKAVGQIVGAGVNAAAATGTGLLYGLAGAPTGNEEEGALQGAVMGAGTGAIPAVVHGGFARQGLEQVAANEFLRTKGAAPYGDPDLDAAHAEAMQELPQSDQDEINAARGLFRGHVKIVAHTPEAMAPVMTGRNTDALPGSDPAKAVGLYDSDTNTVYLNSRATRPNVGSNISQILGHEGTHGLISTIAGIDPSQSKQLESSIVNASLNPDGTPTLNFRRFMQAYNGGESVNWRDLPQESVNNEPSKDYYLAEVAAQTGRAMNALKNPGKYTLAPEASDIAFNAIGDYARRSGRVDSPDIGQGLTRQNNSPLPADPNLFSQIRDAYQTLGQQPRSNVILPADAGITPSRNPLIFPPQPRAPIIPPGRSAASSPRDIPLPDVEPATRDLDNLVPDFRSSQAYQDALAILKLPKKAGGQAMSASDAQTRLDAAVQHPDVPDTTEGYLRYAQTGQPPRSSPNIVPPTSPKPAPSNAPNLIPPSRFIQPDEGGITNTSLMAPMMSGNKYSGSLVMPTLEDSFSRSSTNPLSQDRPATSRVPQSQLSEGPSFGEESSAASDAAIEPTPRTPESTQTEQERQVGRSSPDATTPPETSHPLSADDIARIESETEATHTPNAYPRSLPESRAQKQAADLAKAKADAVAKAHSDALPPEDDRVRAVLDPDTGALKLSGKRFVAGDAFHDQLLRNATDAEKANLGTVQDAIGQGKALNFDYDSALPLRGEDTNAQRQESQALSTASDREQGTGLAQEANHTFVPLSASPTASGHAQVFGYAPDKVLGNAETAIRLMQESGLSDRLPYTGINDPSLAADIRAYTENHANGFSGQGVKLKPTEGVTVPAGDPNFVPTELPPAKAHFINLIMGQDDTLSQKQAIKTGPNAGKPTNSATLRNFAAANDNIPSASGEVNPLRDELNRKGVLTVGNDKGSGEVLHSAFETIKPGLITRFNDQPGTSEVPPLRAASFEGDRGSIAPGGKVPNARFAGAGFLPASVKPGEKLGSIAGRDLTPEDFTLRAQDARNGYQMRWMNPQDVEDKWSKDAPSYYIPPGGGGPEIGGRIDNFKDWLQKGKPIEPGRFLLDKDGVGSFDDGRHRTRAMIDAGLRKIPVAMKPTDSGQVVKAGDSIPGTNARAAEDLPIQRYGNATVTGKGVQFLPAYHGTPHEVDRFDSSKIGTGEGAQVYGHGLYFAENKEVAQSYKDILSSQTLVYPNGKSETPSFDDPKYNAAKHLYAAGGDFAKAKELAQTETERANWRADILSAIDKIQQDGGKIKSAGNLYTVDLDTHPKHLIDWDKPLNAQPGDFSEVIKWVNKKARAQGRGDIVSPQVTGSELYQRAVAVSSGPEIVSERLNDLGFHGIRYYDQGSRATAEGEILGVTSTPKGWQAKIRVTNRPGVGFNTPTDTVTTSAPFSTREAAQAWADGKVGSGTANYVMFDDSKVRITHRNDQPITPEKP